MALTWRRTLNGGSGFHYNYGWLAAVPAGSTIRRTHFAWGFVGHTSAIIDMSLMENTGIVLGLVTTIGNGTETPPDPITDSGDVDPPTQRWIWWEFRVPVVTAIDEAANIISWRDSAPQEPTDTRAQVLATGIPAGDTLNLWASWDATSSWDASGDVNIWVSASVLYG